MPTGAVTLCTIGDYIAMKLCGRQTPVIDASNAAGLGFFDAEKRTFNQTVLRSTGIDPAFLPSLTEDRFIGICRSRARVAAAIGDNQASFLSAVRDREHDMLVNVGTGSQFSVFSSRCMTVPGLETRPMPGRGMAARRSGALRRQSLCVARGLFRADSAHDGYGYECSICGDGGSAQKR